MNTEMIVMVAEVAAAAAAAVVVVVADFVNADHSHKKVDTKLIVYFF